ncbi:Rev7p [Sugiyamaella lignohabitans]|uniref:Rev7p n=1 Tax=Sugiyamaella lignohabitans TaxID=796027 RepID=A0A167F5A7_9ASCO|nr:Rev7p [Sugiyamaella lignohabitans]ANB14844.1 Rev7p [Sugiyamaella lignohabitans]
MSSQHPGSFSELLGTFHEFLVVLVHNVLYLRGVYPPETFRAVRKYGIALHQCRHPGVNQWIEDMAVACMSRIKEGGVGRLSIVILREKTNTPLERFVVDISDFPEVPESVQTVSIDNIAVTWTSLLEEYRACLATLAGMSQSFGKLPADITFTLIMELKPDDAPSHIHPLQSTTLSDSSTTPDPSPWITADRHRYHLSTPLSLTTHPIRFVDAGPISFNLSLEEDKQKLKLPSRP